MNELMFGTADEAAKVVTAAVEKIADKINLGASEYEVRTDVDGGMVRGIVMIDRNLEEDALFIVSHLLGWGGMGGVKYMKAANGKGYDFYCYGKAE